MNLFRFECLALVSLLIGLVTSAPEIKTPVGVLKGVDSKAPATQKPSHVYYGIPYAAAPVGDLRFRPPQPFTSDDADKVLTADFYKPACPQGAGFMPVKMSEDCLFLNVFAPGTNGADFDTQAKKKVLIYIHGGAFQVGDASTFPANSLAADYDMVIVTIQYRLGPFGFMSSGTEALPGNYGLRDQIFALQWVRDNIAMFGGDPEDVTLSGESAGSASCSLINLSPLSKGLFNRVIMMSGSALSPWAIDMTNRETFDKMARRSGCVPDPCEGNCDRQIVECLRTKDKTDIVNFILKDAVVSEEDVFALDGYTSYAPVIDGEVLPRDPFDLMRDVGYMKSIGALDRKYIIGVDNNEAMLFVLSSVWGKVVDLPTLLNIDTSVAKNVVKNNLHSVFPYPVNTATMDLVSQMYFNPRDANGLVDVQRAVDFMSDIDFVVPAIQYANHLLTSNGDVDVYFFLFDLFPPLKDPKFPLTGATHGSELAYLFDENGPLGPMLFYANMYDDSCKPVIDILRGAVTTFVKTGVPTLPNGLTWPKYATDDKEYLAISADPKVKKDIYNSRVSLWMVDLPKELGMTTFLRGLGRAPLPDKPPQNQGNAQ